MPVAIKAGFRVLYAPVPKQKDKYRNLNETSAAYNSIFNSIKSSVYSAYGLDVGMVYNF